MENNAFVKGLKNASIGVKRAVERMSIDVMSNVGLSNPATDSYPKYDHILSLYLSQTDSLKHLRSDALSAFEAISRSTATAHALAARLNDTLPPSSPPLPARLAAEALLNAQASIADEVLSRVERRLTKRVIQPANEELDRARDLLARVQYRKKVLLDAQRYRSRVNESSNLLTEDERKAKEKSEELAHVTEELLTAMTAAIPRRAALVERSVAETFEFQRRFYLDSARAFGAAVDAVGIDRLAAIRGSGEDSQPSLDLDDDLLNSRLNRRPPQPPQPPVTAPPRRSNGPSLWDEDDDEVDHVPSPGLSENPFDRDSGIPSEFDSNHSRPRRGREDSTSSSTAYTSTRESPSSTYPASAAKRETNSSYPSGGVGARESTSSSYPSSGVGARESTGSSYPSSGVGARESTSSSYPTVGVGTRESTSSSYPTSGVGARESTASSYPTGGSRQRESLYPTKAPGRGRPPPSAPPSGAASKPATKENGPAGKNRNRADADILLNFDDHDVPAPPTRPSGRSRRPAQPAPVAAGVEDLLDLGSGPKRESGKNASTSAMEGDLLGDFANFSTAAPARSRSTNPPRQRNASPSMSASSSAPSMAGVAFSRSNATSSDSGSVNLEREQLRKKHEAEIKARADEKLAAVRERERAEEKERDQKDNARGAAEARVNQWTGNGTRRGNLRALLASLDTVLYPGATWKTVTMDSLKANSKVKVNYHKAILQVHPDKIGSKNLPADQQVLAELIFDELKNGYEVWTAEQEGRPPPPGSVGPKNAMNGTGFGGMSGMGGMSRAGMYNNMGGMGRGGMGMGGMGGLNRNMGGMGMGGMGGMGRGNMGGMGGRGMNGMGGMGGYGAQAGRRGTGMGNIPQGYGRSGQQRR